MSNRLLCGLAFLYVTNLLNNLNKIFCNFESNKGQIKDKIKNCLDDKKYIG